MLRPARFPAEAEIILSLLALRVCAGIMLVKNIKQPC